MTRPRKKPQKWNFNQRTLLIVACVVFSFFAMIRVVRCFLAFLFIFLSLGNAFAARGDAATQRSPARPEQVAARSANVRQPARNMAARNIVHGRSATARSALPRQILPTRSTINPTVTARAASAVTETRTGAEYEQCKSAYFSCMDQFCALKNDSFKRCSCNDRVFDIMETQNVLQDANQKLTAFNESLDAVGLSTAQATAMRTSSDGENALTSDSSASKALLTAIMNSIRGEDASVGGKFSDLNSINITMDTTNAFGITDSGQAIASSNGKALYSAIYNQCRNAVKPDCNDASLQRAVTAYIMAIENDCNTVQRSIDENKKKMTAAVREGSAMLDLARVENRKAHNIDDMTTCLNNVESAVKSDEVCGENYRKCLDNGQFIDITTGAPLAGVKNFFELENLLTFADGTAVRDQRLSKLYGNEAFVKGFENRVKKFARPALDKCTENADEVWADFLDKALVDIFYAQRAKVNEVKQGCFDFVSACYMDGDKALTAGMASLSGDVGLVLVPGKITVTDLMCKEFTESCDNMFAGNIVAQYVENKKDTDLLASCRAVARQCLDNFGGPMYENYYYPHSGMFTRGRALDWLTLRDENGVFVSTCAKQLNDISSCTPIVEEVFGGFDFSSENKKYGLIENDVLVERKIRVNGVATEVYNSILSILSTQCENLMGRFVQYEFLDIGYHANLDVSCVANFGKTGSAYEALIGHYRIKTGGENMCPKNYESEVDISSWGICSCWEYGARRSLDGASARCEEIWDNIEDNPPVSSTTSQVCPTDGVIDDTTGKCSGVPTAILEAIPVGTLKN